MGTLSKGIISSMTLKAHKMILGLMALSIALIASMTVLVGKAAEKVDGFDVGDKVVVYSEGEPKFNATIYQTTLLAVTFKKLDADEYVQLMRYKVLKLEKLK